MFKETQCDWRDLVLVPNKRKQEIRHMKLMDIGEISLLPRPRVSWARDVCPTHGEDAQLTTVVFAVGMEHNHVNIHK